jgi:hypothetical protein
MDIRANLQTYLEVRSPTDRYASFDYCFNYFQSRAEQGRLDELAAGPDLEVSCLQLGFYLASWGMYRGSTKLLTRSLPYLAPTVKALTVAPPSLWTTDVNGYTRESIWMILEMADRLRKALPDATDTLVTKIMLGTFGCVPALDTYVVAGSGWRGLNSNTLGRIATFYVDNAAVIDAHRVSTIDFATRRDSGRLYTRAKVIDMIFFVEGGKSSR